jgi:hypothetical protein
MHDLDRKLTRTQWTWTFVPFAFLFAFAMMSNIAAPEVAYARTLDTARAAMLEATPAIVLYILAFGRKPLGNWWRLFWSFGCLMYLTHFWLALGPIYHGNLAAVFAAQGTATAASNLLFTAVWAVDALLAWTILDRPRWLIVWRTFSQLFVFVSFFAALVIFHDDSGRTVGLASGFLVVSAIVVRWLSEPAAESQPIST